MTLAPKCDCGHGLVRHPTRGACTRCACTWYHPNVRAVKAKARKPLAARGATKAKKEARYKAFLSSAAWKRIRREALERAGNRCEAIYAATFEGRPSRVIRCEATERLTVHHVRYGRFGGTERPEDLNVLCAPCHNRVHALEGKRIA